MSDTEKDRQIREQFDRYIVDSKVATVGRIRELLLSDEFMTAFAKKFLSTPMPSTIIPGNSASVICGIDKAKSDSFSVIYEWAGKENEVQNERSSKQA